MTLQMPLIELKPVTFGACQWKSYPKSWAAECTTGMWVANILQILITQMQVDGGHACKAASGCSAVMGPHFLQLCRKDSLPPMIILMADMTQACGLTL